MIVKAQTLPADCVFIDLEDAVAPAVKAEARANAIRALSRGTWGGKTVGVRINDAESEWAHLDVLEIVRGAGSHLDCVIMPKVERVAHVHWLDVLLSQLERESGLSIGGIGIELQIEGPVGLRDIDRIVEASPRVESLILGSGDFMAAMRMPSLTIGSSGAVGFDPLDSVLMTIVSSARARGVQAIDGPYGRIRDGEGFRRSARRSAAFGCDGKWVLHPDQIEPANEIYSPSQHEFERAVRILDAYEQGAASAAGPRGAVMLDGEMLDEASRKLAEITVDRGCAAGMTLSRPPTVANGGSDAM